MAVKAVVSGWRGHSHRHAESLVLSEDDTRGHLPVQRLLIGT